MGLLILTAFKCVYDGLPHALRKSSNSEVGPNQEPYGDVINEVFRGILKEGLYVIPAVFGRHPIASPVH